MKRNRFDKYIVDNRELNRSLLDIATHSHEHLELARGLAVRGGNGKVSSLGKLVARGYKVKRRLRESLVLIDSFGLKSRSRFEPIRWK